MASSVEKVFTTMKESFSDNDAGDRLMVEVDTLQVRLLWVKRLRTIALALGAERTRSEMLPFLSEKIKSGLANSQKAIGDEVLASVAEELGEFHEFVGGASEAHCLLEPLELLCQVDETTVRNTAVNRITKLSEVLTPDQLFQHLAPKVLKLVSSNPDWFTARVSACGLYATAYKAAKNATPSLLVEDSTPTSTEKLSPVDVCNKIVSLFELSCADEPMVRRTAALKLGEVAEAFGKEITRSSLLPLWIKLISETEQESIRVNAVRSAPAIFHVAAFTPEETSTAGTPAFLYASCAQARSWRVRIATSEVLPQVADAIKRSKRETREAELILAADYFVKSLEDHEAEVRHATAAKSAAAASVLLPSFVFETLFPKVVELVTDEGVSNRVELAGVLLEMADPLGLENAKKAYVTDGLVNQLVQDASTNLRLAVIGKLACLIGVITIGEAGPLLNTIVELCADKNWRVRHAALLLYPQLAQQMDETAFTKVFITDSDAFKQRATDNCAKIRFDWVECCKQIGEVYGVEWLESNVVATILQLQNEKNYQLKAVLLHSVSALCPILKSSTSNSLHSQLLPAAIEMRADRVPNLKLLVATSLGKVAACRAVEPAYLESTLKPTLLTLTSDEDADVRTCAEESLKLIEDSES